jgi:hypothetical protein
LPFVAVLLSALLASSYLNLIGVPTEILTRAGVLSGLIVAACAFVILLLRQGELPPQDYQRLRSSSPMPEQRRHFLILSGPAIRRQSNCGV